MFEDLKTNGGGFWGSLICINEMTPTSYANEWLRKFMDEPDPHVLSEVDW
jgi:hypothetical protein